VVLSWDKERAILGSSPVEVYSDDVPAQFLNPAHRKNQPGSERRPEWFNVDERVTILYITLHIIGLLFVKGRKGILERMKGKNKREG
jgi:hypothetical protein